MTKELPRSFHNPVAVEFGFGTLQRLPHAVGGRRAIVVSSQGMLRRGTLEAVQRALGSVVVGRHTDVAPNPTVASATAAHEALAAVEAEVIVAIGGGSVIDTAKAVAAQRAVKAEGWLSAHLRDGVQFPGEFAPLPILAIPTTAGTGSEVTMWGTIWDELTDAKHSISHPRLYPERALVDPELTLTVPPVTTAATALDALSHAMEAIWNRASNPVSDALATRAIGMIPSALRRALRAPDDRDARERLSAAALLAGLAMSNTRTALAHSISYPLTAELGVPHGFACSLTLPELLGAIAERVPERGALLVEALGGSSVDEAVEGLYALLDEAGTRAQLRRHVDGLDALRALRGRFITPGRADNFPLPADQASAQEILEAAYRGVLEPSSRRLRYPATP